MPTSRTDSPGESDKMLGGNVPCTDRLAGASIGLLTIALTYRAMLSVLGLWQWVSPRWKYWGGYRRICVAVQLIFQLSQSRRLSC